MSYLHSLAKRRHWGAIPAVVALASLAAGVWLGLQGGRGIELSVNDRSAQQPGTLRLAWQTYIHAGASLAYTIQTNNGLRRFLVNSTDQVTLTLITQ